MKSLKNHFTVLEGTLISVRRKVIWRLSCGWFWDSSLNRFVGLFWSLPLRLVKGAIMLSQISCRQWSLASPCIILHSRFLTWNSRLFLFLFLQEMSIVWFYCLIWHIAWPLPCKIRDSSQSLVSLCEWFFFFFWQEEMLNNFEMDMIKSIKNKSWWCSG